MNGTIGAEQARYMVAKAAYDASMEALAVANSEADEALDAGKITGPEWDAAYYAVYGELGIEPITVELRTAERELIAWGLATARAFAKGIYARELEGFEARIDRNVAARDRMIDLCLRLDSRANFRVTR